MKSSAREVRFTPVDNRRLAALCGSLDENLKRIEAALDVSIARRGERFNISGQQEKVDLAAKALDRFYRADPDRLGEDDIRLGLLEMTRPNEVIIEGEAHPVLLTRRPELRGRTERQVKYIKQMQTHDISFGVGPAGTGKTYLAVACAVDAIERDLVKRIVLTRPAVEAGERLGFLPGDLSQKVDPYLRPLYDALYDLMGFEKVTKMFERSQIEVAPLAFMRGRTLNQSFIILDEAQNTSPEQMKMFLTRIGFGTKAVITGDVTQIDLGQGKMSGLVDARNVLHGIPGIGFTVFQSEDVVRHPLVQAIVNAYDQRSRVGRG